MTARRTLALCSLALFCSAAAARAEGMAPGDYECWFFSEPRSLLNFTVTGEATYSGGDGEGRYALSGGAVTFSGGHLDGVMPDGFTTLYEVRNGKPTLSFVSGRGAEAAFCEKS